MEEKEKTLPEENINSNPQTPAPEPQKEAPEDDYSSFRKMLVFTVGKTQFCVDSQTVDEIINNTQIYSIPFVPPCVEGVINLRGQPVTVFNPFQTAAGKNELSHCNILKFKCSDEAFGIRISKVDVFTPENKVSDLEELNMEKLKTALREALGYKYD